MRRRVEHHNDGSVRMDFYTFRALKVDAIWETLTQRRVYVTGRQVGKVREFK